MGKPICHPYEPENMGLTYGTPIYHPCAVAMGTMFVPHGVLVENTKGPIWANPYYIHMGQKIMGPIYNPCAIAYGYHNGDTALHVAANWGYSSVVKLLLDTGASILLSKKGNTPLHACFLNQDLSYDHHRNVTVAFMMTHPNIVSIKNSDGKTVIDLYEESECRKYETEHRCLQKEELLLILKGGQFPVIDFTPSGKKIFVLLLCLRWCKH
ncbi:ankyrin repeat domain-containing protein 27-like [Anneissia japonica]|uniref:ankyrin repeat domain-containing protein 27-like n=1 Tax=Anneissia japonica TaxID=1529436 RepID=UPI0014258536|nr:ankyrin repeat domain-containing protein 27-like [Anneissia japonica]